MIRLVPQDGRREFVAVPYADGRRRGDTWNAVDPAPARTPSPAQLRRHLPKSLPTAVEQPGEAAPYHLAGVFLMPDGSMAACYGARVEADPDPTPAA